MGQHYIPQHYLKNFAISPDFKQVWVYQKGSYSGFTAGIRQVANENNRWPRKVEEHLAEFVENPANTVLNKINERQSLTQQDRKTLTSYIISLFLRVPKGLQRMKDRAPEVLENLLSETRDDLYRFLTKHPDKEEIVTQRLTELPLVISEFKKEFPLEAWYQNLISNYLVKSQQIIPNMNWIFFTTDNKHPFITSDNPVFYFEDIGIGNEQSELSVPISSQIMFWASWRKATEGYFHVKDTIVNEFNRRTASISTKYAYCCQEMDWVSKLMNKKKLRINRLG